jgi:hypothetical protein
VAQREEGVVMVFVAAAACWVNGRQSNVARVAPRQCKGGMTVVTSIQGRPLLAAADWLRGWSVRVTNNSTGGSNSRVGG